MIERLDRLATCDAANDIAMERLQAARPVWVDVGVAADAIPRMEDKMLLHADLPSSGGICRAPCGAR